MQRPGGYPMDHGALLLPGLLQSPRRVCCAGADPCGVLPEHGLCWSSIPWPREGDGFTSIVPAPSPGPNLSSLQPQTSLERAGWLEPHRDHRCSLFLCRAPSAQRNALRSTSHWTVHFKLYLNSSDCRERLPITLQSYTGSSGPWGGLFIFAC